MATFTPFSSLMEYSGVTDPPVDPNQNNTDVIAPNVKLYIEGVQVPWNTISISQTYTELPTATVQIPPASGLMDIIRGYQPKVHIFFQDVNTGGDRLLFWGHIVNASYSKSRAGSGNSFISFQCAHKNALMMGFTLDFTGWADASVEVKTDPNIANLGTGVKLGLQGTDGMILRALAGINGIASTSQVINQSTAGTDIPVDLLDPSLADVQPRYYGMAGVVMNLWNQVKKASYSTIANSNPLMTKMYIPLIEEGIAFFKRFSGHSFIEGIIQNSKYPYCHVQGQPETNVVLAPYFRSSLLSAFSGELAVRVANTIANFTHEIASFPSLIKVFLETSKYELITLASPAEIPVDVNETSDSYQDPGVPKIAVETIVKSEMHNYFSPICNVLLPRMWHSVEILQDDVATPTRMIAVHDAIPGQAGMQGMGTSFKGPASYREAVAYEYLIQQPTASKMLNLSQTTQNSYPIPSKYEQGCGVRPTRISLPWWLSILSGEKSSNGTGGNQEEYPTKGTSDYNTLMMLTADWNVRYAVDIIMQDGYVFKSNDINKTGLNPFSPTLTGIFPYQRLLITSLDYEFANRFAASRSGRIECLFNPYIIPGYPMDLVDDSPNHPSFHGFCTSVTHNITSRSISTSVGIAAATSYAELSNYYLPPVNSFLMTALNIVNGTFDQAAVDASTAGDTSPYSVVASTLLQNPVAKQTADLFYKDTLGVGAVAPDDLIHFSSGRAYPLVRLNATLIPKTVGTDPSQPPNFNHQMTTTGRESDDFYSSVGNFRLVSRQIESKDSIKTKFGVNFIDLGPTTYNSNYTNYLNPKLAQNFYLEPGASLFLDYMETSDFLNNG